MPCVHITSGRLLNCKTAFSGVQAVSFKEYTGPLALGVDGSMTTYGATGSVYRFELKNDACSYEEKAESNRQTGTTVVNGTLQIELPVLDKATRDQIRLLSYGRPQIFVETFQGDVLLVGAEFGAECASITLKTGGKKSDFSGFSLTFNTEERNLVSWLGATASTAYKAAVSATNVAP